jgi:flagellar basal-body rod modification protein FlgD
METSPLSALTALGQSDNKPNSTIAGDFDTFLKILTTQLQNQNPLEPLDTNQFTQQLVQFSSVEQEIKTNKSLEQLIALSGANAFTGVVSYIGKEITAEGAATNLANGSASWTFNLPKDAPVTNITIRNSVGTIVKTDTVEGKFGANPYIWDGKTNGGTTAADGLYSITVEAKDADDNFVKATTTVKGIVEGVDLTANEPLLKVNGASVRLSSVKAIDQSPTQ